MILQTTQKKKVMLVNKTEMVSKQMPSSRTVALVVTYNRKALLLECIEALRKQTVDCSILVVDNASNDGTRHALEPLIQDGTISYIGMSENLGGAGGFCQAMKSGVEEGFEYLWAMDDDCIPEPDALEKLLDFAGEHPDFGFLSSKVLWTDGSACKMNEPKLIEGNLDTDKPVRCRQASFVSFFTSAKTVIECGLPIADFFIWGDDVEYTRRIIAKHDSWFVPQSIVVHKTARNTGSDISRDEAERLDRYRYAYRNEVYIAREEGLSRKMYQLAKICYHTLRVLVVSPDQKSRRIGIIWSASKEGLRFNPGKETVHDPRA